MAEEQRGSRLWREAVLIFAAWTVFGLILANQFYMHAQVRGHSVPWGQGVRPALFDAYLWAFATVAVFWLARRFPLERGRMLRNSAVHLAGAVVLSLGRVVVIVEVSRQVEWLGMRTLGLVKWQRSGSRKRPKWQHSRCAPARSARP